MFVRFVLYLIMCQYLIFVSLLFPSNITSHFPLTCYSALTNVHKAISQGYKIVCVGLQTPSTTHKARLRAGERALVEMGHQLCAGEQGVQDASVEELASSKEDILSWVWF